MPKRKFATEILAVSLVLSAGPSLMGEEKAAAVDAGMAAEVVFLDVPGVVERVRSSNPRLLFEKESVVRALQQSYQQRAALLPQLALRAEQTRQQFAQGFAGDAFDSPPFNTFNSRLDASLAIFDTEKYANYRIAKLGETIAQNDYEVAIQDFTEQAIQIYFTHLRDLRQIEIINGNIERETDLLTLATDQFEAGAAIKIDVTRAEVRVATEKRDLIGAETAAEDSMLQLKALLDFPFEQEIRLDRSIIGRGIKSPPSLKRYGGMRPMIEMRPELASQEQQLEQAKLARRAADWQRLPTIDVFGQWGYDSNEAFDGDEGEAWLLGVRASIPIFEGFRITAERREADAAVRQNTYLLAELRNELEREFRFAMINLDSRWVQIGIAGEEVRLGLQEVEQATERYREGLADNRELIDAQDRLSDAERSELRAIYLYGLSRLAFARSIGSAEKVLD